MKIAIVGGGAAGLTTALQLKNNHLKNSDLTIIADSFDDLVSYVAPGIFHIGNDYSGPSEGITRKWVKDSYDFYWDIWKSRDASKAGITPIPCYMFSNVAPIRHDWMVGVVPSLRDIEPEEFSLVSGDWKYGSFMDTMVTQCSFYLPWARSKLEETGTTFLTKKLDSLKELYDDYDLIINCSGLGARQLCQDRGMIPVRGQIARVKAPWMKACFYAELDTYIIPGFDGYVTLGGTRDFNSVKSDVCRHAYRSIRERCETLLPSLKKAPTVQEKVGFRPYRAGGVRVEAEKIPSGHRAVGMVHNYGHGGYGVCTAPGCAAYANLLAEDLHKVSSSKL